MILWLSIAASAQDAPLDASGDVRTIGSALTDFPVDATGATHGQTMWLDQRVRLGLAWTPGVARLATEWDVLTGQLAGDTWAIPDDVDARGRDEYGALTLAGITPRQLYAETVVGSTQLSAGLVTSHWGLGILANDGAHDPLFGRTDLGDRVVRVRATLMPSHTGAPPPTSLLVTGAFDVLVDDDIGALKDDQSGFQGIFSMLWVRNRRPLGVDPGRFGMYTVVRQQYEQPFWEAVDDPRATTVLATDAMVDLPWALGGGWTLRTAAEVVGILGRTDRATTYEARDVVGVAQLGAAAHLTATSPSEGTAVHLIGGYGTGDPSPDDGVISDFVFDRNFAAGLVLFDQVMGALEAAGHAQLVDPANAGVPPDGVDALVTEGAVKRAAFVQPAVVVSPLSWAEVRLGAMVAFATAPYSQPFYSYRAGGVPTNQHDLPADGRLLGTEVDWALAARRSPDDEAVLRPSLEVQGGHLVLGAPLRGAGPDVVHHVMGVARLQW